MILLIWSIYVISVGKYQLASNYGVTGGAARLCGIFNLLVSLGLIGSLIPVDNLIISFLIQLGLIIIVGLVVVSIHGNDFTEEARAISSAEKVVSNVSQTSRLQVSKTVALWESTKSFSIYFVVIFIIVFGIISLIMNIADLTSISDIPNSIARIFTRICLLGVPFFAALFLALGHYKNFDVIQKK